MLVNINSVEKVKEFIHITSRFDFEADLVSGRYVVDAKSIMGIFSLDLTKAIELKVQDESDMNYAIEKLKKFQAA